MSCRTSGHVQSLAAAKPSVELQYRKLHHSNLKYCILKPSLGYLCYFGLYILEENRRNISTSPLAPFRPKTRPNSKPTICYHQHTAINSGRIPPNYLHRDLHHPPKMLVTFFRDEGARCRNLFPAPRTTYCAIRARIIADLWSGTGVGGGSCTGVKVAPGSHTRPATGGRRRRFVCGPTSLVFPCISPSQIARMLFQLV